MSAIPNVPEDILNAQSSNPDAALQHILNNKDAVEHGENSQTNGEAQTNGADNKAQWHLHEAPVENQRPLRVIVIGAGYSGIYLGIRLPERLRNCEIVIYEKNAGMGGTWYATIFGSYE